jgi:hypothetical protein
MELVGTLSELFVRMGVATVLLMAGSVKIASRALLTRDISAYRLVPERWSKPIGMTLPIIEVGLGVLLVLGELVTITALACAVLFGVFLAATASAFIRRLNVQCGCFGLLYRQKLGIEVVIRDSLLLLAAAYLAIASGRRLTIIESAANPIDLANVITLAGLIAAAAATLRSVSAARALSGLSREVYGGPGL